MNSNTTAANQIVDKIPSILFFNNLQKDRYKVLSYLDYLFNNVSESKSINFDLLARAVIAKHLRVVSMKVVEYEVLLVVALKNITLDDLSLDTKSLVVKLMQENPDKTDLDKMNRVLAQIMTKLPIDLRESVTGIQKVQIFQLLSKNISMSPKLVENFINYNPSLNKDYMFTMEIDKGNYDTLNKEFLRQMKAYTERAPYVSAEDMEYLNVATKLDNLMEKNKIANNKLNASYINTSPVLMTGANDDQLYYYDEYSGTLSPIQVSNDQAPITQSQLEDLLISQKVSKDQINALIANSNDSSITASLKNLMNKYFGSSPSPSPSSSNNSTSASVSNNSSSVDKPLIPDFIKKALASNLLSGSSTNSTLSDTKQSTLNYSGLSDNATYTYGSDSNVYKSDLSKAIDANILANIMDYFAMGYTLNNNPATTTTKAGTTTTAAATTTTKAGTTTTSPATTTTLPTTTAAATTTTTTVPTTTPAATTTTVPNVAGFRNMSESNNDLTQRRNIYWKN